MPFITTYTSNPTGVVATFSGEVTAEEIIAHLEEIADRADIVYRLGDMRGMTKINASLPELHRIAILECSASKESKLRKLALVGDMPKYQWLIDTYYLFVEKWVGKRREYETEVFGNIEDAYEWLEIPRPENLEPGSVVSS